MPSRPAQGCTLVAEPAAGAGARYRLAGVAGFKTAKALLAQGSAEFAGRPRVEVDLTGLESADSAGLAVLLTWVERAHRAGQALRFTGLPAQLGGIARVCGVEALLRAAEAPEAPEAPWSAELRR